MNLLTVLCALSNVIVVFCMFNLDPNDYSRNIKSEYLTSVYDAMKNNVQNQENSGNGLMSAMEGFPDYTRDNRMKRNVLARSEYYNGPAGYNHRNDEDDSWTVSPKSDDIICTSVTKSQSSHKSFSALDDNYSQFGNFFSIAGKIFFAGMAIFGLPLMVLQMFLVPLKILVGLKAFALANSILLGSLVSKYINSHNHNDDDDDDDDDDDGVSVQNVIDTDSKVFVEPNDYSVENDDVKRILKFVKDKNKNW